MGRFQLLATGGAGRSAHRSDWDDRAIVAVHNLSGDPVGTSFTLDDGERIEALGDPSATRSSVLRPTARRARPGGPRAPLVPRAGPGSASRSRHACGGEGRRLPGLPAQLRDPDDGVGDLAGVVAHLDHLNDGTPASSVDAIWLSPFYPSPMADFGYDVADYTGVDPLFGSLADADRLLREAHARHPGDHRLGPEPHLRPAPLVPGVAVVARRPQARLVRLARRPPRGRRPTSGAPSFARAGMEP